jgi:hypothetical protein
MGIYTGAYMQRELFYKEASARRCGVTCRWHDCRNRFARRGERARGDHKGKHLTPT